MQARRGKSDNLVGRRVVHVRMSGKQFVLDQQITQLLQVTHRGRDLDLRQGSLAVAGLHQGGDLWRPDTGTGHAFFLDNSIIHCGTWWEW